MATCPQRATTGSWKGSYCQIQTERVICPPHRLGLVMGPFCFSYRVLWSGSNITYTICLSISKYPYDNLRELGNAFHMSYAVEIVFCISKVFNFDLDRQLEHFFPGSLINRRFKRTAFIWYEIINDIKNVFTSEQLGMFWLNNSTKRTVQPNDFNTKLTMVVCGD